MKTMKYAASLLLLLTSIITFAKGPTLNSVPNAEVLFIQVAKAGELVPNKNDPSSYNLVLKHVEPFTSYFTDRPNRVTGLIPTDKFISLWSGQTDLKQSPPNVAIETTDIVDGSRINKVLMLSNPTYDAKHKQMIFTAKLLDPQDSIKHRVSIGYTVLFIDDFHWDGNQFGGTGGKSGKK